MLLATPGASVGRSCGPAPQRCRPIVISGSARSATEATDSTGRNCAGQSAPSVATSLHNSSRRNAHSSRLDGQYGTGAVLCDLAGFSYVMRGKDYAVLDHPLVQTRLHLPANGQIRRPESEICRSLYDCPLVSVGPSGQRCRVVLATHPASEKKSRVGLERGGLVYELFLTNLPQGAFTAADVVELYLHRGAYAPALADEDQEQDPDRWCSHAPCGQQCWQIVSPWVWNVRLELGHQLAPEPLRTTEFAPVMPSGIAGYASAEAALPWKAGRFSGQDFPPQADGTLRCPAGASLYPQERRSERGDSLRVVYGARMRSCRPCRLREQCQWHGAATKKPRQVSLLLHPLKVGAAPLRLSGLEPQAASARLHAAPAPPTHRGADRAGHAPRCKQQGGDPFPCAAGALPSLRGRAIGTQCPRANGEPTQNHPVRRP